MPSEVKAFKAARQSGEEQECGLAAMLGFIERHGSSRSTDWDHPGERVAICAAFRRRDGKEHTDYLFHAAGRKDAFEGFGPKDVRRACAEAGLLEAATESGKVRFQINVKVPGRGTECFYLITGRGLEAYRRWRQSGRRGRFPRSHNLVHGGNPVSI